MKTVLAQSYNMFISTMESNGLSDDNVHEKDKTAFIEVMGEQDLPYMPFHFKKDHPNVLRMIFDDVDEVVEAKYLDERDPKSLYPATEAQARQIVDFVDKNNGVDVFLIHCAAGVSRSAGIAKFIYEHFGGNPSHFKMYNPHTMPNARIDSMLRRMAQEKHQDSPDGYT